MALCSSPRLVMITMDSTRRCQFRWQYLTMSMGMKVISRFISRCYPLYSNPNENATKKFHVYSQKWDFSDTVSTSNYLLQNVVYNKGGVVAVNKPPGLGSSHSEPGLYESIPSLSKALGYKNLQVVLVPEKSMSGVTVLAVNSVVRDRLDTSLRRARALNSKDPKRTYLAVTVGNPVEAENQRSYGVTKISVEKNDHYMILRTWSNNAVKRREVYIGTVWHKELSRTETASLVSLSSWLYKRHAPRMFLSDILLSPALGDTLYGRRVGNLFGRPVLLKPWIAPAAKALPAPLLQSLNLLSGSEEHIPMHLHHQEVVFSKYVNDKDLVIRAEPPDYFKWTCEKLGLTIPEPLETEDPFDQTKDPVPEMASNSEVDTFEESMSK